MESANENGEIERTAAATAFEGSAARRIDQDQTIETEIEMAQPDDERRDGLADEVRQLGRRVTPEELERRGVKKLRQFTISDLNDLVARTVDRVLDERDGNDADTSRNTVVERTHAALAERAASDPSVRIELLERRLSKLADALDRSEHALAEVLDDVEAGLPVARRYVDALPDNHPLRRRGGSFKPRRALAGRTRSRRPAPTPEEEERVAERRSMLRALAEVNRMDEARQRVEEKELAQEAASEPQPAPRPAPAPRTQPEPSARPQRDTEASRRELEALYPRTETAPDPRADLNDLVADARDASEHTDAADATSFADLKPDQLRLRTEDARPHRGFGWQAGRRPLN